MMNFSTGQTVVSIFFSGIISKRELIVSNDQVEVFFLFAEGQEIFLEPNSFLNLLSVVKDPKFINFRFLSEYNEQLLAGI